MKIVSLTGIISIALVGAFIECNAAAIVADSAKLVTASRVLMMMKDCHHNKTNVTALALTVNETPAVVSSTDTTTGSSESSHGLVLHDDLPSRITASTTVTGIRRVQEDPAQQHQGTKTPCGSSSVNSTTMFIFVGAVVAIGFLAFFVSLLKVCKTNNIKKQQEGVFSTVQTVRNDAAAASAVKVVKVVDTSAYPTKSNSTAATNATRDADTVSVADTDVSSENGSDKV